MIIAIKEPNEKIAYKVVPEITLGLLKHSIEKDGRRSNECQNGF